MAARPSRWGSSVFQRAVRRRRVRGCVICIFFIRGAASGSSRAGPRHLTRGQTRGAAGLHARTSSTRVWVFTRGAASSHVRRADGREGQRVFTRGLRRRTDLVRTSSTADLVRTSCVARAPCLHARTSGHLPPDFLLSAWKRASSARGLSTATGFILCFHSDHLRQHRVTVVTNFLFSLLVC